MSNLISDLADRLIALINESPRSPTKEQIVEVLTNGVPSLANPMMVVVSDKLPRYNWIAVTQPGTVAWASVGDLTSWTSEVDTGSATEEELAATATDVLPIIAGTKPSSDKLLDNWSFPGLIIKVRADAGLEFGAGDADVDFAAQLSVISNDILSCAPDTAADRAYMEEQKRRLAEMLQGSIEAGLAPGFPSFIGKK